ncbi:hypothetical protein [Pseudomonas sp. LS-2]|uniref:DUF6414 family protein n=1 Tax=Pseudomonas sp. LS-2 TaxID=2315859 RepID=UPI000E73841D|nr:hypothetical protein [Pseudomonas sp. LS-2]RJX81304.1 hypothetical protein D3M70_09170 [Pseudomonas sp. LS-2]
MRSFVYLDEYKMYSLSSQLMEGVTDFVVQESKRSESEAEEQKGPITSGQKLAEIIETTSASIEKRFLHDYAFSIFENKLLELDKVLQLSDTSTYSEISSGAVDRRIVRVKARADFLDAVDVMESLTTLADMQDAISIVANNERREEILLEMATLAGGSKKHAVSELKAEFDRLSKPGIPKDVSANARLQHKNLAMVLQSGFKNRLDIAMTLDDCQVRADLKRKCLKDEEDFITKTYSRFSSVELVLLGIVTQCTDSEEQIHKSDESDESDSSMAKILQNSSKALHELEGHFTRGEGKLIILDPIAVYLEL